MFCLDSDIQLHTNVIPVCKNSRLLLIIHLQKDPTLPAFGEWHEGARHDGPQNSKVTEASSSLGVNPALFVICITALSLTSVKCDVILYRMT